MSEPIVRHRLLEVLGSITGVDAFEALEESDDFMSVLNLDSLDAVELTVRLSTEFGVEFGAEPEDLDALDTLTALTSLVHRRQGGR